MLNSAVLVLNLGYQPVHVTSVRRALMLLYSGLACAIDSHYRLYDFQSWSEWLPFLCLTDASYWNVELNED